METNTSCDQKITVLLKFRILFFCYVDTHACYIFWQYSYPPFWIVSLILTDKKVDRVLVCSSILIKKMGQAVSFAQNITFNVQEYLKCWLWCVKGLLWAEHHKRFKDFREDVNDVARQQPMKILKHWRKWFWIIVKSLLERLLMMLVYRSAHAKQFLRMF